MSVDSFKIQMFTREIPFVVTESLKYQHVIYTSAGGRLNTDQT